VNFMVIEKLWDGEDYREVAADVTRLSVELRGRLLFSNIAQEEEEQVIIYAYTTPEELRRTRVLRSKMESALGEAARLQAAEPGGDVAFQDIAEAINDALAALETKEFRDAARRT